MAEFLNRLYNVSIENLKIKALTSVECSQNIFKDIFFWLILPIIGILLILLIMRYKDVIKVKFLKILATKGYIRIYYITENKRIIKKLVKLDTYNNFRIKKRLYTLDKMYDFLFGYDKYGFPVFFYDFQFILPLKITKQAIDAQIIQQLNIDKKDTSSISAVNLVLDSAILQTVYKKKLMSDLYSISQDSGSKKLIIYIVAGIIVLFFLYYTGYLEKIIGYLT